MEIKLEKLPKSEVKIVFKLEPAEIQSDLESAAARISENAKLDGFRPGKAPYDVVKTKVGEMAIWNEAAEEIVRHAYARAVIENKLKPIGSPEVDILKFAPGNPVEFSALTTLLPPVTLFPALDQIKVETKPVKIEEKDVSAALAELQRMQTREEEVERPATAKDKVTMDISIEKDKVPIEGGMAKNHAVYLSQPYYITGFPEEIVGLKKGDNKTFSLAFPKNHYQKHLAGQPADFTVRISRVDELKPPAQDDEFAKSLGQKSLAELKDLLHKNLTAEAEQKEIQREESAALEELVAKTKFEDIPEKLVGAEVDKMIHELEHSVAERGLEFNEYLRSIKKTRDDLKLEFAPQGVKRIKTILAIRELAERENITVDEVAVAKNIEITMNQYKDDAEAQKEIRTVEYADAVRNILRNRKTIEFLREKAIGK